MDFTQSFYESSMDTLQERLELATASAPDPKVSSPTSTP
jgi:hypothetical protein